MTSDCSTCIISPQGGYDTAFLRRYKTVLVSREFLIAAGTGILILASAITGLFGSAGLAATALALSAVAVGGIPMIVGAIRGLFHREVNVDELVAIAIIVSVIFKEYLSAGFVAFMMLFGKVLEDFTAERAKTALGDLGQLTPLTACVRRDGEESEIPLNQVVAGDLVTARSGVADSVREDTGLAVQRLKRSGVKRVVMLTGDSQEVAKRVAGSVGIDEWQARLLPSQKVDAIKNLQAEGYKVAMIGDGINDAPALARADVGVAMGVSGTDVAMETADIVLVKDDVLRAAEAINLSRYTLRTIKQNLAFALVFNLIGIGAAASGILSPIGAAFFHNFGSVAVVVNSARLVGTRNISA